MKNYADLGGCYPPPPSASAENTLLDLHNSSYHTQPHPIIANYTMANLQPSSSFVETPRSPLNVEVSSFGRIFSLPTLTRGKGGNVSTIVTKVVITCRNVSTGILRTN